MVLDKSTAAALASDPRRPGEVHKWERPKSDGPEGGSVDAYALAGMVLGIVGMLAKVRVFSIMSVAFVISAFIQRNADTDTKQLMMSGMFALMGWGQSYLAMGKPNAAAAAAAAAAAGAGGPAGAPADPILAQQ